MSSMSVCASASTVLVYVTSPELRPQTTCPQLKHLLSIYITITIITITNCFIDQEMNLEDYFE